MNLNNYRIVPSPYSEAFELVYNEDRHNHRGSDETLMTTLNVGLDTLLRVALEHDLARTGSTKG